MKRILFLLILCAALLAQACHAEHGPLDDGAPLPFAGICVGIDPGAPLIGGDTPTRSLLPADAETFRKAALFAFDSAGKILLCDGAPVVAVTEDEHFAWSLPLNTAMDIYALVNYGDLDLSTLLSSPTLTESALEALCFSCPSATAMQQLEHSGMPMAGVQRGVILASATEALTVPVTHLFAKYIFSFDPSLLEAAGYTVQGLYLSASQSNTELPFFRERYRQENPDKLRPVDRENGEALDNPAVLYFLENCQGDKSGAAHWYDVASAGLSGIDLCSYIDLGVRTTDLKGCEAVFRYRIYLGEDCTTNFDIRRGTKRAVQLTLRLPLEKGRTDGISWVGYRGLAKESDGSFRPMVRTGVPVVESTCFFFETSLPPEAFPNSSFSLLNPESGAGSSDFQFGFLGFLQSTRSRCLIESKEALRNQTSSVYDNWRLFAGGAIPDKTSYPNVGVVLVEPQHPFGRSESSSDPVARLRAAASWDGMNYEDSVTLTGSGSSGGGDDDFTYTYSISPANASVEVNSDPFQYTLYRQRYVNGFPSGSATAVSRTQVSWASSNSAVATISVLGVATPGATAGTTTIWATYSGSRYSTTLTTCEGAPDTFAWDDDGEITLTPGETATLGWSASGSPSFSSTGVASLSAGSESVSSGAYSGYVRVSCPAGAAVGSTGTLTGTVGSAADVLSYRIVSGGSAGQMSVEISAADAAPTVYRGHTYPLTARLVLRSNGTVLSSTDITAAADWRTDSDCVEVSQGTVSGLAAGAAIVSAYYTCPDGVERHASISVTVLYARYALEVTTASASNRYSLDGVSFVALPMRAYLKEYHSEAASAPPVSSTEVSSGTTFTGYNTVSGSDFSGGVGYAYAYRSGPYRITGTYPMGSIPVTGTTMVYITATRTFNVSVGISGGQLRLSADRPAPDAVHFTLVFRLGAGGLSTEAVTATLPKGQSQASFPVEGILNSLPWSVVDAGFDNAESSYQSFPGDTYEDTTNLVTYYLQYSTL